MNKYGPVYSGPLRGQDGDCHTFMFGLISQLLEYAFQEKRGNLRPGVLRD